MMIANFQMTDFDFDSKTLNEKTKNEFFSNRIQLKFNFYSFQLEIKVDN